MNEDSNKDKLMKLLAVVGFIVALVLALWLAVKIIGLLPGAFSSLASIVDGLYNDRDETTLTVATNQSVVNNSNSIIVSWTEIDEDGTYNFEYDCAEGVAIEIRDDDDRIALDCDTPLNLGNDIDSIELIVSSERRRFTDVNYTVTFVPETGEPIETTNVFTAVNSSIPANSDAEVVDLDDDPVVTDDDDKVVDSDSGQTTTTPAPQPKVIKKSILVMPVSDPRGYVDLQVTFLGVGEMTDDKHFIRRTTIDEDDRGAVQFVVKNIGTKTSDEWKFTAELTSGNDYRSKSQAPLRPNEQAVITIGFDAVGEEGIHYLSVEIDTDEDKNHRNDSFRRTVEVTDGDSRYRSYDDDAVVL